MAQANNYRQLNQELETIVEKLQSEDLDVDQVISQYQRGVAIIDQLQKYLKSAQNNIVKINQKRSKTK